MPDETETTITPEAEAITPEPAAEVPADAEPAAAATGDTPEGLPATSAEADAVAEGLSAEATEASEPLAADAEKKVELTADKVIDIAFGVAVLAGEAANKLAKQLSDRLQEVQDQAPAIAETLQEKGRPVREKFVGNLRTPSASPVNVTPAPPPADAQVSDEGTATEGASDSFDASPVVEAPIITPEPPVKSNGGSNVFSTLFGGLVGNKTVSAEDEISALERRVRELEREVATPPIETIETPVIAEAEPDVPAPAPVIESEPTPAEEATFTPTPPLETLEESSYAMSETDDEVLAEEVEGVIEATAEAIEAADAADTAETDETPAKPKVSRRKGSSSAPAAASEEENSSVPDEGGSGEETA
jgi:hypothetical protein